MFLTTLGTKVADSKMDDITKIIKKLSAKIKRLEMENKSQNKLVQDNDNKNPNHFRRTFNPRFFPRDRRNNEDQKIQPPFQNNLLQDDDSYEINEMEIKDLEPDIDQLDDVSSSQFLTKSEYHNAKMVDYQEMQEMQQNSYGHRSGMKQATQGKKNVKNVPIK